MKQVLYVDCCLRGAQSRTKQLADAFFEVLSGREYYVNHLELSKLSMRPLTGDNLAERQTLLERNELEHPRFAAAHEFAEADMVVIAAPFWDLSFPALLKIYIENISVDGITFGCDENGIFGRCRAEHLVFLTTRGGIYRGSPMEQAIPYLTALRDFFGFRSLDCVAAEGLDIARMDAQQLLSEACERARELARQL